MSVARTVSPSEKLTFRYIAAYRVEGLQCPASGPLILFGDESQGKKVLLTDYSHEDLQHIDVKVTIANFILNATFRGQIHDFGQVKNHAPIEQQERLRRYGATAAYLVVEASHEQEVSAVGQAGENSGHIGGSFSTSMAPWRLHRQVAVSFSRQLLMLIARHQAAPKQSTEDIEVSPSPGEPNTFGSRYRVKSVA